MQDQWNAVTEAVRRPSAFPSALQTKYKLLIRVEFTWSGPCSNFIHRPPSLLPHAMHIRAADLRLDAMHRLCAWDIREGSEALMGHDKGITGVKQNVLKIQFPSAPAILPLLWYRTQRGPQLCDRLINNAKQTETLTVCARPLKMWSRIRAPNVARIWRSPWRNFCTQNKMYLRATVYVNLLSEESAWHRINNDKRLISDDYVNICASWGPRSLCYCTQNLK
jgi:hypothetical protein